MAKQEWECQVGTISRCVLQEAQGPYRFLDIVKLLSAEKLTERHHICRQGWSYHLTLQELFRAFANQVRKPSGTATVFFMSLALLCCRRAIAFFP